MSRARIQPRSKEKTRSESSYEILERPDISAVVARLGDRSLGDESGMSEPQIVEQDAKRPKSDGSLSDLLVTVELRSTGSFGVVAVDNPDVVQSDRRVEMQERLVDAFFGNNIVSGDVGVTGIDAGCDRYHTAKAVDDFSNLLEAASKGEFSAGGIFDQDGEACFCKIEALGGGGDRGGGLQQADFAVGASE